MREPRIAPINAQNSIVLMCSGVTPRRTPIRPKSQPPIMNPIAIPRPCGEMANASPNRNRSRTGQPIDASEEKEDNTGSESTGAFGGASTVLRRCFGRASRTARRPEPSEGASDQEPADHVGRVVHAHVDTRRGDGEVQPGESHPGHGAERQ